MGRPRLTVLGSLNMDISVAVDRLPRPGETVLGSGAVIAPGGKGANQAVAAARLGAAVRMTGCTGDDGFARSARAVLRAEGVHVGAVRSIPGCATGLALITVDAAGENVITVAPGANALVGDAEIAAALAAPCDVLVLSAEVPVAALHAVLAGARAAATGAGSPAAAAGSDPGSRAGAAETGRGSEAAPAGTGRGRRAAAETGRGSGAAAETGRGSGVVPPRADGGGRATAPGTYRQSRACLLNLAPAPAEPGPLLAAGVDWLVVNEWEAAAILGNPVTGLSAAAAAAWELRAAGARHAVVTAGPAGAALAGPEGEESVPGFSVTSVDSVGAGDAFVAALAVAIASGFPAPEALRLGCAAGATATTRRGTQNALPRPADVLAATGVCWPD
jgi:sugar/nucleoside kinase (ribokinase family)